MIRAYREIYLSKAQGLLGDAFDYAINACYISGDDFLKLFIASSVSKRMENGEPTYLAGKSGIEIVMEIVLETTGKKLTPQVHEHFGRSKEYWIGWAVAYYQWYSGRKYGEIFKAFSYDDLQKMYYTLHEADISKFVDAADSRIREVFSETNLKRFRTAYGLTQTELAKRSGVSIRIIQAYEQRMRDINKAQLATIANLAQALDCDAIDLLEK